MLQDFLQKNGIQGKDQLIQLAHAVNGIPWGEARTVEEVLEKNIGTCTGKHLILQACFDELGIVYRPVVCTFKWSDQGLGLPEHLQSILDEGEWVHGHNFVQIQNEDGEWIDLDVTWDSPLSSHGFQPLPQDWDGNSSFIGVRNIIDRWDGASIEIGRASCRVRV